MTSPLHEQPLLPHLIIQSLSGHDDAPWLLIETGIAKDRKMTSFKSIKTDVANAGAKWEDSEVVVDQGVITSRNPGDLEAFSAKIIEEIKEGRHTQRSAA